MTAITILTPGLTLERLHDDRLWIFAFEDENMSRELIDAWMNGITAYNQANIKSNERFLMYDFSRVSFLYTNRYFQEKLHQVAMQEPKAQGRCAFVLGKMGGSMRPALEFFTKFESRRLQPRLQTSCFISRDEALRWVLEAMGAAAV